jgi:hypothetical protein
MPPEFYFFSAVATRKIVCRLCYTLSTLLHAAKSLHFAEASLFKVENLKCFPLMDRIHLAGHSRCVSYTLSEKHICS